MSMKLFTADWCVNCKPIKRLIEDEHFPVDVIDVDKMPDFVRASGIRSIPCLLLGDGTWVLGTENIKKVIKEAYGSATNSN
ncbi:Glutaredoxin-like protein NrdH [compost metagenome]